MVDLTVDPCFATFACLCDNGYFRVAENMPAPPSNYLGSANLGTFELYKDFLRKKDQTDDNSNSNQDAGNAKKGSDDGDDGLDRGAIAGIVIGSVVFVILAIVLIYCVIKNYSLKDGKVTPG